MPIITTALRSAQAASTSSSNSQNSLAASSSSTAILASTPLDKLVALLYQLDSWTDQIEPQSKPQRFGNLAFRDWGGRLTERSQQLHEQLLPKHLHVFIPELKAYLDDAFGSFTRIDYGSGHELCFFAWVCFLYRLNFFHVSSSSEVYSNKADTRKKAGKEQEETNTVADVDVEEAIGIDMHLNQPEVMVYGA
uniref:Serine/threonine-protein phosphatase 2A activator n=1 Tax=Melanopsichium pennsylvanicum 4 TaxID=1398559 RepID=A0A077RDH3_9BASI|nr:related to RRD1-Resistant to Rapamycin Deletion (protein phosphatase 2A regulator activity) [Melanopsichium pennsylvanicum 4]